MKLKHPLLTDDEISLARYALQELANRRREQSIDQQNSAPLVEAKACEALIAKVSRFGEICADGWKL